ncbi:MAG: NFACT family protein [Candidatus Zixiibacteriota bacterium]|nr:MAG: NFACT family protein [candidate division Zixibacteria bacterium]
MQTALHIYSLVTELKSLLIGAKFTASEFYKKEREAYLFFKAAKGHYALGLAYHPVGYGTFCIPRSKVRLATKEKPWPFFQPARGAKVVSIAQYDLDRIFRVDLKNNRERFAVVIEAIGPNGNFWLLDRDDRIIATLRNKKHDPDAPYEPPPGIGKLDPFRIDSDQVKKLIESGASQRLDAFLRKNIIGLDTVLIDEILVRAGLEDDLPTGELSADAVKRLAGAVRHLALQFEQFDRGYLYELHSGHVVYPFRFKSIESEDRRCKFLSLGVYDAIRLNREAKTEKSQRQMILDAVERFVKKLQRKLSRIQDDLETADNFDKYRKIAETLKINIPNLKKGLKSITLEDAYCHGTQITVKLNPALTPAENTAEYFKKYRKGRDALQLIKRRYEIAGRELAVAKRMRDELNAGYDNAVTKYAAEIEELLPSATTRQEAAPRLPYRAHTLPGGVTIFIGRDGEDNDRTTFSHAKPYELWFHASQCPGSHVVMKFPEKNFRPSQSEVLETAAIAAYHSRARNSKTVPVIYTQRKYVRKPRRAKPGLVIVEREKLVMVEPKKPG